jgi:PII-like signaling protein
VGAYNFAFSRLLLLEISDNFRITCSIFAMVPPSRDQSPAEWPTALKARDLPEECSLLRIFLGEADEYKHRPLYREIVLKAQEHQLAGATVLRGPMGFGRSTHLHNAHILRLSLDLPIVIEIVDETEKIRAFLPELQKMMRGGLITMERAQVYRYRD